MEKFEDSINSYFKKLKNTIDNLDSNAINKAMNAILIAYQEDADIYIFGNGGSAATASHFVCDFNKGTCEKLNKKFRFICLNDNVPTLTAIANDIDYERVFLLQLEGKLKEGDIVIGISGSGNSKNVILAAEYAKSKGNSVIGITGYDGGKLKQISDYSMHVNVDDMQITEDIHMVFDHMMMKTFYEFLYDNERK